MGDALLESKGGYEKMMHHAFWQDCRASGEASGCNDVHAGESPPDGAYCVPRRHDLNILHHAALSRHSTCPIAPLEQPLDLDLRDFRGERLLDLLRSPAQAITSQAGNHVNFNECHLFELKMNK